MPVYEVEKDGQIYEVEAPTPEAAARAFDPPTAAERIATQAKAATKGISGVARAPRALMEGLGALATDVAQLAPEGRGLGQAVDVVGERFREATGERRAADEAADPGSVMVGDLTAGVIPLPFGKAKSAETLFQATRRATAEGAVAANLPYQELDERGFNTAMGVLVPGAMQALRSFPGAIKNSMVRAIQRRADPETQALRNEAAAGFRNPNTGEVMPGLDDYNIAQVSGDPRLRRLGAKSADITARDAIRAQLAQRVKNVQSVIDGIPTESLDPEQRAAMLYNIVRHHNRALTKNASDYYGASLNALAKTEAGKNLRVPMDTIKQGLLDLESEMGDIFGILDKANDARLAKSLRQIRSLEKGNVTALKLDGLVKLRHDINSGRTYGQAALDPTERAANKIRLRLNQAIEEAVQKGPDNEGFRSLREIEQEYAVMQDGVRRVQADAMTKLFGDKAAFQAGPDAVYDQFLKLSPDEQRYGARLIGDSNPEMLGYMRKRYLQGVLDEAQSTAKPGMTPTLDVDKLTAGLASENFLKSPLFSAQEKKWARGALADFKIILNQLPDTTRVGTELSPEDLAINIVSRSPEFVARLAARAMTGLKLEDVMFTAAGRKALSTTANLRSATSKQVNMATAYWLTLLSNEVQDEESQQQQ